MLRVKSIATALCLSALAGAQLTGAASPCVETVMVYTCQGKGSPLTQSFVKGPSYTTNPRGAITVTMSGNSCPVSSTDASPSSRATTSPAPTSSSTSQTPPPADDSTSSFPGGTLIIPGPVNGTQTVVVPTTFSPTGTGYIGERIYTVTLTVGSVSTMTETVGSFIQPDSTTANLNGCFTVSTMTLSSTRGDGTEEYTSQIVCSSSGVTDLITVPGPTVIICPGSSGTSYTTITSIVSGTTDIVGECVYTTTGVSGPSYTTQPLGTFVISSRSAATSTTSTTLPSPPVIISSSPVLISNTPPPAYTESSSAPPSSELVVTLSSPVLISSTSESTSSTPPPAYTEPATTPSTLITLPSDSSTTSSTPAETSSTSTSSSSTPPAYSSEESSSGSTSSEPLPPEPTTTSSTPAETSSSPPEYIGASSSTTPPPEPASTSSTPAETSSSSSECVPVPTPTPTPFAVPVDDNNGFKTTLDLTTTIILYGQFGTTISTRLGTVSALAPTGPTTTSFYQTTFTDGSSSGAFGYVGEVLYSTSNAGACASQLTSSELGKFILATIPSSVNYFELSTASSNALTTSTVLPNGQQEWTTIWEYDVGGTTVDVPFATFIISPPGEGTQYTTSTGYLGTTVVICAEAHVTTTADDGATGVQTATIGWFTPNVATATTTPDTY